MGHRYQTKDVKIKRKQAQPLKDEDQDCSKVRDGRKRKRVSFAYPMNFGRHEDTVLDRCPSMP